MLFFKGCRSNAVAVKKFKKIYGSKLPLPVLPIADGICVMFTVRLSAVLPPKGYPMQPAMIFKKVFPKIFCRELGRRYQRVEDTRPKRHTKPDVENPRSDIAEALHLGIWAHYSPVPRISRDTRCQSEETKAAIRDMFEYLQEYFAPTINSLLRYHAFPQFVVKQMYVSVIQMFSFHLKFDLGSGTTYAQY